MATHHEGAGTHSSYHRCTGSDCRLEKHDGTRSRQPVRRGRSSGAPSETTFPDSHHDDPAGPCGAHRRQVARRRFTAGDRPPSVSGSQWGDLLCRTGPAVGCRTEIIGHNGCFQFGGGSLCPGYGQKPDHHQIPRAGPCRRRPRRRAGAWPCRPGIDRKPWPELSKIRRKN